MRGNDIHHTPNQQEISFALVLIFNCMHMHQDSCSVAKFQQGSDAQHAPALPTIR